MIQWQNSSFAYDKKKILQDVSLQIPPGLYFVVGTNGSGKSTFLRLLGGWLKAEGIINHLENAAYLPTHFQMNPSLKIQDIVEIYGNTWSTFSQSSFFSSLQLSKLEPHKMIFEFSSGEKQRLLLANILLQNTDSLLLDEPFSHLDWASQKQVINFLPTLKYSYVFIATHDFQIPLQFPEAKLLMIHDKKVHDLGLCRDALISDKFQKSFHFHTQIIDNPIDRSSILAIAELQ
jgi:iron complex transport system ATP-binding protein